MKTVQKHVKAEIKKYMPKHIAAMLRRDRIFAPVVEELTARYTLQGIQDIEKQMQVLQRYSYSRNLILNEFTWNNSIKGYDYWTKIHNILVQRYGNEQISNLLLLSHGITMGNNISSVNRPNYIWKFIKQKQRIHLLQNINRI